MRFGAFLPPASPVHTPTPHGRPVRTHGLCRRQPALSHPAHVRPDGAAAPRRIAGGLEHGHGLLPVGPAGGLRLRACRHHAAGGAPSGGLAPGAPGGAAGLSARRRARGLAAAGVRVAPALAARAHDGCRRAAVLRHRGDQSAAAEMVCRNRPPAGGRSLFPLRGQQRRQHAGAAQLPGVGGAALAPRRAEPRLDVGLRAAGRPDRRLRGPSLARAGGAGAGGPGARRTGGRPAHCRAPPALGLARASCPRACCSA